MSQRICRIVPVLTMLLFTAGAAMAIDSRFELDFKSLDAPAKAQPKEPAAKPAKETRSVEKGKKSPRKKAVHARAERKRTVPREVAGRDERAAADSGYRLRLVTPADAGESNGVEALDRVWDRLVPAKNASFRRPVEVRNGKFDLSLDPAKYPVLPAADGGRILIDRNQSLPALVRNLIEENETDIRIVSENPADRRRFASAVLAAANFYSVEEDSVLDFGTDPKIVVRADFKIEKTAESLLQNDLILLNLGGYRSGMPDSLAGFLKKHGFQVVESVRPRFDRDGGESRQVHQITAKEPQAIADSLLSALSVRFDRNRSLSVLGVGERGISLKIMADRYFEDRGDRFVVSMFNGDPVSYTLIRLMETEGYKVIILDRNDDLRTVSEKFISRMRLNGHYGTHSLWPARDVPYSLEMSGVMISDADRRRNMLVTNRVMDPLARELAEMNGYSFVRN